MAPRDGDSMGPPPASTTRPLLPLSTPGTSALPINTPPRVEGSTPADHPQRSVLSSPPHLPSQSDASTLSEALPVTPRDNYAATVPDAGPTFMTLMDPILLDTASSPSWSKDEYFIEFDSFTEELYLSDHPRHPFSENDLQDRFRTLLKLIIRPRRARPLGPSAYLTSDHSIENLIAGVSGGLSLEEVPVVRVLRDLYNHTDTTGDSVYRVHKPDMSLVLCNVKLSRVPTPAPPPGSDPAKERLKNPSPTKKAPKNSSKRARASPTKRVSPIKNESPSKDDSPGPSHLSSLSQTSSLRKRMSQMGDATSKADDNVWSIVLAAFELKMGLAAKALCQELHYLSLGYHMCGTRIGLIWVKNRYARVYVIDEDTFAVETCKVEHHGTQMGIAQLLTWYDLRLVPNDVANDMDEDNRPIVNTLTRDRFAKFIYTMARLTSLIGIHSRPSIQAIRAITEPAIHSIVEECARQSMMAHWRAPPTGRNVNMDAACAYARPQDLMSAYRALYPAASATQESHGGDVYPDGRGDGDGDRGHHSGKDGDGQGGGSGNSMGDGNMGNDPEHGDGNGRGDDADTAGFDGDGPDGMGFGGPSESSGEQGDAEDLDRSEDGTFSDVTPPASSTLSDSSQSSQDSLLADEHRQRLQLMGDPVFQSLCKRSVKILWITPSQADSAIDRLLLSTDPTRFERDPSPVNVSDTESVDQPFVSASFRFQSGESAGRPKSMPLTLYPSGPLQNTGLGH